MKLQGIELTNYLYSATAFKLHIALDVLLIVLSIIIMVLAIRLVVGNDE